MNTNLLLAVSVILVGVILISINYSAMSNLYMYSAPLNSWCLEAVFIVWCDKTGRIL